MQDRMRERAGELWGWLEEGAHFYVCGDAKRMASDVDAPCSRSLSSRGALRRGGEGLCGEHDQDRSLSARRLLIRPRSRETRSRSEGGFLVPDRPRSDRMAVARRVNLYARSGRPAMFGAATSRGRRAATARSAGDDPL